MSGKRLKSACFATAAASALVWFGAGTANATPIPVFFGGANGSSQQLSDNSAEYLINHVTPAGRPATQVDVGDELRGVLQINTIENSSGPGNTRSVGTSGVDELTALFQVTVTGKFCASGGGHSSCVFSFGPSASFATDPYLAGFTGTKTNAVVAFFQDATPDFQRGLTRANGEDSAASLATAPYAGSQPFWLFGLDPTSANEFWTGNTASDNIADATSFPSPITFGSFNIGLDLLANPGTLGPALGTVPCLSGDVSACGSGSISAPGAGSGFQSWDNVDFVVQRPVPEPATLTLLGVGLLGAGYFGKRRARKQAQA